jgi:hypothetical protein
MARIWKEPFTKLNGTASLMPRDVILVSVASFTFRFASVEQIRECLSYYTQKTHCTSRISASALAEDLGEDWKDQRGWEVERWFERLPMYLLEEPKRLKVVKALSRAMALAESGEL